MGVMSEGSFDAVSEVAKASEGPTSLMSREISDGVEMGLAGETTAPMERRA